MSLVSIAGKHSHYLSVVLILCLLALPVTAQQSREVREGERRVITESENGSLCAMAKESSWENFAAYVGEQYIDMETVLRNTICGMSVTTSDPYAGNVWEATARYSGFTADIIKFSARYLLRDRENHELFVALVTGGNVPLSGIGVFNSYGRKEGGVFREFRDAWRVIPAKRDDLTIAARAICLSIDRFNVQGLDDIRANECMTPPFVFPSQE